MELETIRMCAVAAADPTIGINAMLTSLPILAGDTRPSSVTVYNSMDHGWVARRTIPELGGGITFPAIAILIAEPSTLQEVRTIKRDGAFPVGFAYVQKLSDSAKGNRDAAYTGRAMLRFLTRFLSNDAATFRQLNGIGIIGPHDPDTSTRQPPTEDTWGAGLVTAITIITLLVRETAA